MAMNAGELNIKLTLEGLQSVEQQLSKLNTTMTQQSTKMQSGAKSLNNNFMDLVKTLGLVGLAMKSLDAIKWVAKQATDMENVNAEFKVMLGNQQKALQLTGQLRALAKATPFETADLAQNAKILLQFGISMEKVIPTLTMLGDVAGNDKERLHALSLVFGQISSSGKLMGQDLLQLINVGFNPLQIISQKTGLSMSQLRKDMEDGKISFEMVQEAFKIATSSGGLFYKNMETQSKTFTGRLSTLRDEIGLASAAIGTAFLPLAKDIVIELTKGAEAFGKWASSAEGMKTIGIIVGDLAGGLAVLKEIVVIFSESLGKNFAKIMKSIADAFQNATGKADDSKAVFSALGLYFSYLNAVMGVAVKLIVGFINELGLLIELVRKGGKNFGDFFGAIMKGDMTKAGKALEGLGKDFTDFFDKTKTNGEELIKGIGDDINSFSKNAEKNAQTFSNAFTTAFKKYSNAAISAQREIQGEKASIFDMPVTSFEDEIDSTGAFDVLSLKNPMKKIPSKISMKLDIEGYSESVSQVSNITSNMLGGISKNFATTFSNIENIRIDYLKKEKEINDEADKMFKEGIKDKEATTKEGLTRLQAQTQQTANIISSIFQGVGDSIKSIFKGVQDFMQNYYDNQNIMLQQSHDIQISSIEERLAKEIELIENNGVTKQEALQQEIANLQDKLSVETDETKKASIQQEIDETQKELNILQVNKKATEEKKAIDKDYALAKYKNDVELFNAKKAMDIATVWINAAIGVAAAWASAAQWGILAPTVGVAMAGVLTGLITTMAGVNTGLIAAQQPPPPPRFQTGGITSGGLAMVGERGTEIANFPAGTQITNATDTAELLKPNINVMVMIGDREIKDVISEINYDNRYRQRQG